MGKWYFPGKVIRQLRRYLDGQKKADGKWRETCRLLLNPTCIFSLDL
jgi:hypothetical protein